MVQTPSVPSEQPRRSAYLVDLDIQYEAFGGNVENPYDMMRMSIKLSFVDYGYNSSWASLVVILGRSSTPKLSYSYTISMTTYSYC